MLRTLSRLLAVAVLIAAATVPFVQPGPAAAQRIEDQRVEAQRGAAAVRGVLFWLDTCPHCHEVLEQVLPPLQKQYGAQLQIQLVELRSAQDGQRLEAVAAALGMGRQEVAVPFLVIGRRALVGSAQIRNELRPLIETTLAAGGIDFPGLPGLIDILPPPPAAPRIPGAPVGPAPAQQASGSTATSTAIQLPLVGSVDLAAHGLTFSTVVLGLLDGVNPCSLWVLSLLLALVVSSGSRIRTALVGLAFLTVAVSTYGLFMAGLFGAFAVVGVSLWVRLAVAAVAVSFAALNIKDYFWFQVGPSLALSDRYKPGLFRRMRALLAPEMSGPALMGGAAVMALGVTLVELPCTAGLPLLWARLLTAQEVTGTAFGALLGLYLLMYALDEVVMLGLVLATLRATKLQEEHGRLLKLVGGMVMLVLGVVLLVRPEWMGQVDSALLVFGAALGLVGVTVLGSRALRPRPARSGGYVSGQTRRNRRRHLARAGRD